MAFDNSTSKNFQYSTVAVAPTPPASGLSLSVLPTDGLEFAEAPFWAFLFPPETRPLSENAEVIRVTAKAGDKLTIERAQQGSSAQQVTTGWTILAGDSAASWSEVHEAIEAEITNRKTAVTNAEGTAASEAAAAQAAAEAASDPVGSAVTAEGKAIAAAATKATTAKTEAEAAATSKVKTEEEARKAEVKSEKERAEAAEALRAPLASPALTGVPVGPTAAAKTNTTQLATTAFTQTAKSEAEAASDPAGTSKAEVKTEKERAEAAEALKAPLASPVLTGVPKAPTAAAKTNTEQLATTAFAQTTKTEAETASDPAGTSTAGVKVERERAEAAEALKAPIASPTLTGVPAGPTAAAKTSTTQLATTAFAQTAKSEAEAASDKSGAATTAQAAAEAASQPRNKYTELTKQKGTVALSWSVASLFFLAVEGNFKPEVTKLPAYPVVGAVEYEVEAGKTATLEEVKAEGGTAEWVGPKPTFPTGAGEKGYFQFEWNPTKKTLLLFGEGGGSGLTKAEIETIVKAEVKTEKERAEAAEALKAPLASPVLTGTPKAPTAAAKTNTEQLATTAFVHGEVAETIGAWTAPESLGAGAKQAASFYTVDARLEGAGGADARLRGTLEVEAGKEIKATATILTLPAAFRPSSPVAFVGYAGTGAYLFTVSMAGVLSCTANLPAASKIYLDNMTWSLT